MAIRTQRTVPAQDGGFLRQLLQNRRTSGGDFGRHNEVGDLRIKRHCFAAFAGGDSASRLGGESLLQWAHQGLRAKPRYLAGWFHIQRTWGWESEREAASSLGGFGSSLRGYAERQSQIRRAMDVRCAGRSRELRLPPRGPGRRRPLLREDVRGLPVRPHRGVERGVAEPNPRDRVASHESTPSGD